MRRFLTKLLKFISHPITATLLRIALGGVFIVASFDKITSPDAFAENIANYRLLHFRYINVIAIILPWLELITGSLLLLGVFIKENAIIINGLLVVFIIAITQALIRGLDISCGCFDTASSASRMTLWTLYWDIIWLFWGVIVILCDDGRYSLPRLLKRKTKEEVSSR
ncbi:MAG: hypothetical protein Kow0090_00850 [Myxococcota bacterium]